MIQHPDPYEWTPDEEEAWRVLERAAAYHDRMEYLHRHGEELEAHRRNVAVCNALLNEGWNDDPA